MSGDYSAITLCKRIKEALTIRSTTIPLYLNILEQEIVASNSKNIHKMKFKMHCFRTGEKQLGRLNGVLNTEFGFIDHSEGVKVKYNSTAVSESELLTYAKKQGFKSTQSISYRKATSDVHYYFSHSNYKYLPLSELQKTKINSAIGSRQSGKKYLSPKQMKWLDFLQNSNTEKVTPLFKRKIEDDWSLMEIYYAKSHEK